LQSRGYQYITIAASQSINENGSEFKGRYSHKKAACLAGLGGMGKNALFIHHTFGAKVRLGTIFTDCDFETENAKPMNICNSCDKCIKACPAMALRGKAWDSENPDEPIIDAAACSKYMKTAFHHIGRGAVCGICIKVCK
jgi:epoxyqueuosine reductase QueG